jgi:hypothetical protein
MGATTSEEREHDRVYAYAQGLLCLCALASPASISAYACVPEAYRVHTSRLSRLDNSAISQIQGVTGPSGLRKVPDEDAHT